MELDYAHALTGDSPVFGTNEGIAKTLGKPGFAGAWRPLKDQVLSCAELRAAFNIAQDVDNT